MKKSEAEKKWCWMSMSASKGLMCTTTDCMAWVQSTKLETKPLSPDEKVDFNDGWEEGITTQHRHVPDPENGYCDALSKAQE